MKKIILSINSTISWILKILIAFTTIYFFLNQNFLLGIFAILVLAISLIPAAVNRSYNINLPWSLDFWLTLWLALCVFGSVDFYKRFSWWDNFLHFSGTTVLVYLAFVLIYALNFTNKIRLSIPLIGFFTFLVGIAFGALWEIAEFLIWRITGHNTLTIGGNIEESFYDTFSDLQLDVLGALVAAIFGMKFVARQRHIKLHEYMQPFVKIFGEKIRLKKEKLKRKIKKQKTKFKRKIK
jgi:hypothetical protein